MRSHIGCPGLVERLSAALYTALAASGNDPAEFLRSSPFSTGNRRWQPVSNRISWLENGSGPAVVFPAGGAFTALVPAGTGHCFKRDFTG
jgi:hypothetical protein